jgi:hypothetical protein
MPVLFVEELNAEMAHGYTVDFVGTRAFVQNCQ